MTREVDALMFGTITTFKPEDDMVQLKMLLQERVDPKVLSSILKTELAELVPYIHPFKIEQVSKWCRKVGFWEWLLLPDSFKVTIEKAKQDAADAVAEIVKMESPMDPKLAMVRLKAAELLLKTDFTPKQRVNNTLKVYNRIPKNMANKSVEALEAELRQLQEQNV